MKRRKNAIVLEILYDWISYYKVTLTKILNISINDDKIIIYCELGT